MDEDRKPSNIHLAVTGLSAGGLLVSVATGALWLGRLDERTAQNKTDLITVTERVQSMSKIQEDTVHQLTVVSTIQERMAHEMDDIEVRYRNELEKRQK
jgi:hypothetical protein